MRGESVFLPAKQRRAPGIQASGNSVDDAIVIRRGGVPAEYRYLEERFGTRGIDWELVSQSFIARDSRSFDELSVRTKGGMRNVVFDITYFFGG